MRDQYLTYLFRRFASTGNFNSLVGEQWRAVEHVQALLDMIILASFEPFRLEPNPAIYRPYLAELFEEFKRDKAILLEGDDYVGYHFRFDLNRKNQIVGSKVNSGQAHIRISKLGDEAFLRALQKIVAEDELNYPASEANQSNTTDVDGHWGEAEVERFAPATDRIVTFSHNQPDFSEIAQKLLLLRDDVRGANDLSVEPDARERTVAALESASILWNSGQLRVIQMKVGVLMAVEDAAILLSATAKQVAAALLVDAIKAFFKSHFSIDLDHL